VEDTIVKLELCQFGSASWVLWASMHQAKTIYRIWQGFWGCFFGIVGGFFPKVRHQVHTQWATTTLWLPWISLIWIPSWFSKHFSI